MKRILILLVLLVSTWAHANSGGGGGGPTDILKLDPVVVNLSGGHYIQFTPQLKLADPAKADYVKAHMPILRHQLIIRLIGKDVALVQTANFMASFSDDAATALNEAMKTEDIKMLLFDTWLIQ